MTAQTTAHTPARINPDHLAVLIVAASLTGLLAVTSFLLSFAALEAVAEWAAVPDELRWAVPVFIDAAILVYTLAALVARARSESAKAAWYSLALWTVVSVTANALHAWTDIPAEVRTIAGMTIAGLAPIAVLLATHTLADLLVDKPDTMAASAVVADGRADTDTTKDGQADSGRTGTTPDPLVVLGGIEQAAPRTDIAADARTDTGAGRRDAAADASSVRAEQPALELVPVAGRTDGHLYDQAADTTTDTDAEQAASASAGRTRSVRDRRPVVGVEAVRPQIEELARQGMSGREIAAQLGVGRTRTCEIVRDLREAGVLVA